MDFGFLKSLVGRTHQRRPGNGAERAAIREAERREEVKGILAEVDFSGLEVDRIVNGRERLMRWIRRYGAENVAAAPRHIRENARGG